MAKNEESKKKWRNIPIVSHAGIFNTVIYDGTEEKAIYELFRIIKFTI